MAHDTGPTSLYRYYDSIDVLIYVGITSRGVSRNREHNSDKAWWPYVVRQDVEHYPTRAEAHRREVDLIRRFTPPFNTAHNPTGAEVKAAYMQLRDQAVLGLLPSRSLSLSNGRLPLDLIDYEESSGVAVFRTRLAHTSIVPALEYTHGVKVRDVKGVGVGQVTALRQHGPLAVIDAFVRRGLPLDEVEAHVKDLCRKGPKVYGLRRITLPQVDVGQAA